MKETRTTISASLSAGEIRSTMKTATQGSVVQPTPAGILTRDCAISLEMSVDEARELKSLIEAAYKHAIEDSKYFEQSIARYWVDLLDYAIKAAKS